MNRLCNESTNNPCIAMEKNKDWQLELLMEKLRSKSSQAKSFTEASKAVRMALLDKRYALDSIEKTQHMKCLDTLQHSIKVSSLQSMVERLESLTRQLGLKFVQAPSGVELFISSDMFYLEIVLNQNGAVSDVKVHHEGKVEQQSCEELVNCLSKKDFGDFTAQLEGFTSIYQLNAEKKMKAKAFTALQSLEADLSTLAQLQNFIKEPFNVLHKSPVGILEKRRGGHAMRLTYFVSPYDLIDTDKCDIEPISIEGITSKNLGYSVTVYMEGTSAPSKLQTVALISINRALNGKGTPSYIPLSPQNSAAIPACFVLRLNNPMPICVELVNQINAITELDCVESSTTHPLLSLIATYSSNGKLDSSNNRGLFVTLPDQSHCYFLTESRTMEGVVITNIPFTHPAHVAKILVILRQQALFNALISSCIRPNSKQDIENMVMLEVSALNWNRISISMEHPFEETMSTVEIDLTDISNLICCVLNPGTPVYTVVEKASDISTKVLNRSFSIPITMRAILGYWDKQIMRQQSHFNGLENFNLPLGSGDPGGRNGNSGNTIGEREVKQPPPGHGMVPLMSHPHQGMFLSESLMSSTNFSNFQQEAGNAPVLTNVELTNILSGGSDKPKRHKRKASEEQWKNTSKRKPGDDDLMDASSCDSTSRSTPLSQDAVSEIQTPNSVLGFHSDLELSALDASELIGEKESDFDADDLGDVEELLSGKKEKSPLIPDFDSNKLVSSSVSITPINAVSQITTTPPSTDRRSSIEIFPITPANAQLSSSVTITPISQKSDKDKDKKSSKRSDDKVRLEKKKKRKREGSPMGPPEKIPSKPETLSKPVGVTIKPTESPPNSPSIARKFSQSPTHNRNISGKLSPNLMKPVMKTHSPKHSPAHVPSSPKHVMPGISSPKSSPKHPSTSGSGKPSMSALKNAASSPSSKSDLKKSSSGKDSSREKDKKTGGYTNAVKSSKGSIKVKPLDINTMVEMSTINIEGTISPSGIGIELVKPATNLNQMRNRKSGNLSAIVDKLAKAQNCDIATDLATSKPKERVTTPGKSDSPNASAKASSASKLGVPDTKNSEYVLKHSSDCMKLTINKARTRDPSTKPLKTSSSTSSGSSSGTSASSSGGSGGSSSSSNSIGTSGTGSPKNHTGLKPGVNSGPASKKPQPTGASKPSINNPNTGYLSGNMKQFSKSSSSSSATTSSSGIKPQTVPPGMPKKILNFYTPKGTNDLNRMKDRPKLNKSSSEKSIFGKSDKGKASPTQETENLTLNFPTKKQFDKSFQIPKLSARTGDDKKQAKPNENNVVNKDKLLDIFSTSSVCGKDSQSKYPMALSSNKLFDGNVDAKIRSTTNNALPNSLSISTAGTMLPASVKTDVSSAGVSDEEKKSSKDDAYSKQFPISACGAPSKQFQSANAEALALASRNLELTSKFVAPAPKAEEKKAEKKDDVLVDYAGAGTASSNTNVGVTTSGEKKRLSELSMPFPPSPSVSVHIVKSPAPSPLVVPSPHSAASPGITDDELMDEALVGLGK